MTLVYHSTDTKNGILIARRGVILSNLEQRLEEFRQLSPRKQERLKILYPGKTMEQAAFEFEASLYGEHEIETRVKCLRVVKRVESAIFYAMSLEDFEGGLILGIDLDDSYVEKLDQQHYGNQDIKFVPNKLSIDTLKEVHLSPTAKRKHESLIKKEFSRYNPKFIQIR